MYLYQNEIFIIKYLNYDDTTKMKAAGKYLNFLQSQFLNYYALKIIWNYKCASAHQLIRHSGANRPKGDIYKYK